MTNRTLTYTQAEDAVNNDDSQTRDQRAALRLVARSMLTQIMQTLDGAPLTQASQPNEQADGSLVVSYLIRNTMPPEYIQIIALDIGAVVLRRTTDQGATIDIDSAVTTDEAMKNLVRLVRRRE